MFIEIQKSNLSPKKFYENCKMAGKEKGMDLESWIAYNEWKSKDSICIVTKEEIYSAGDYQLKMFLKDKYSFILEFTFDGNNKGMGYFYYSEI